MTLSIEFGSIQDPDVRRALEQIAQAFPVAAQNLASGVRTVRGSINGATGAIIAGTGFTAARTGVGTYTITFAVAFTSAPSVALTSTFGSSFAGALPTTTGFGVQTFNTSTLAASDLNWSFIAEGP